MRWTKTHLAVVSVFALVLQAASISVAEKLFSISASYLGDQCTGTPYVVSIAEMVDNQTCTPQVCSDITNSSRSDMISVDCSTDYLGVMRSQFGNFPYVIYLSYGDEKCTDVAMGFGYPASGSCAGGYNDTQSYYVIASINQDNSASLEIFEQRSCLTKNKYLEYSADANTLATHSCDANWFRWYSSKDKEAPSGSSSSQASSTSDLGGGMDTGAIVGIVAGCALFMLVVAVICVRRQAARARNQLKSSLLSEDVASLEAAIHGQSGIWNDDIITAKRISRDKVFTKELISHGSFGEVYTGVFNDRNVAVKMLLPATRGNLKYVADFLTEAKMNATMEHPHIVSFIGVAWDALTDLCVVLEFMDGGELRALLDGYLSSNHPVGFNRQKATIALQVCHALTYLHSLTPSVIHRDLKSRNILLNNDMQAKLSDFGISRERLDRTMTAGVGTSLWMAPEVMLGERYDDKVDIFSFGVVLSELDVHTLPYARVRKEMLDSNGREMADSMLLQKVALGTVKVEFSAKSARSISELGRACVSIDPTERPSAAEALYKLQVILARKWR